MDNKNRVTTKNVMKLVVEDITDFITRFVKEHSSVTILIPSGSVLNHRIVEAVTAKSSDVNLLEGIKSVVCKLTVEEVDNIVLRKDSLFRQVYGKNFNQAYGELCSYFDEMDNENNGVFSRHFIRDSQMRDVLMDTLKISPDRYARDSKYINGQEILIINDSISREQPIQETCRIILESYAPKSITVLTILSKLNEKNMATRNNNDQSMLNEVFDVNGSKVFVENGEVKTILSEEIQQSGYMSVEDLRGILHAEINKQEEFSKNGSFMTADEFCQRLERLKISLINKHR